MAQLDDARRAMFAIAPPSVTGRLLFCGMSPCNVIGKVCGSMTVVRPSTSLAKVELLRRCLSSRCRKEQSPNMAPRTLSL